MTKENTNSHRKDKVNFQAFLTQEEARLVALAKESTGQTTGRGVLLYLARAHLGVPDPVGDNISADAKVINLLDPNDGIYTQELSAEETNAPVIRVKVGD